MGKEQVRLTAYISEMDAGTLPDIPLTGVDLAALTAGDDAPMFVTIEAVAETVSRNQRRYGAEVVRSIIDQVNANRPDGYAGHLRDEERPYAAPLAETLWLGGAVQEIGGKLHGFIKGYVLPSAVERRDYLQRAKAAGKKVAVSIYGIADHVLDQAAGVFDLADFVLESIDWARSGAEGIVTSGAWALTSEQAGGAGAGEPRPNAHQNGGVSMPNKTLQERLAGVTAAELRQAAPELVGQIVSEMQAQAGMEGMRKTLQVVREALELTDDQQDSLVQAITDLQSAAEVTRGALATMVEALGLAEGATPEQVANAVTEMASVQRLAQLDAAIAEAVANEAARPAVRVLAVAEMRASDKPVSDIKAFVGEMVKRDEVKAIVESVAARRMPTAPVKRDNRNRQEFKFLD